MSLQKYYRESIVRVVQRVMEEGLFKTEREAFIYVIQRAEEEGIPSGFEQYDDYDRAYALYRKVKMRMEQDGTENS